MFVDNATTQPVIDAGRFVLRPLRRADAGPLALYAGDERVARGTRSIPHPLPPGAVEAYIARAQAADRVEDIWAMDASSDRVGELLGVISLKRLDRDQAEVGYWVAPALWNAGIASDAVKALIAANPGHHVAYMAEVFQDNTASARVLTNAGFEYLGDAETFSVARGGMVRTWTYIRRI